MASSSRPPSLGGDGGAIARRKRPTAPSSPPPAKRRQGGNVGVIGHLISTAAERSSEPLYRLNLVVEQPSGEIRADILQVTVVNGLADHVADVRQYDWNQFLQVFVGDDRDLEVRYQRPDGESVAIGGAPEWRILLNSIACYGVPVGPGFRTRPPAVHFRIVRRDCEPPARAVERVSTAQEVVTEEPNNNEQESAEEVPAKQESVAKTPTSPILVEDDDEPDDATQRATQEAELNQALIFFDLDTEMEMWRRACRFFGHNTEHTTSTNEDHHHSVRGLRSKLHPHQLWAAYRMLFSYRYGGRFGTLLADDMGLGKTVESLAVAVLMKEILDLWRVVQDERQALSGDGQDDIAAPVQGPAGRRHLPAGYKAADGQPAECPSGTYVAGFACPCVESLPTYELVADTNTGGEESEDSDQSDQSEKRLIERGPAFVMTPNMTSSAKQWHRELVKHVDSERFKLYSVVATTPSQNQQVEGIEYLNIDRLNDDFLAGEFYDTLEPANEGHSNAYSNAIFLFPTSNTLIKIISKWKTSLHWENSKGKYSRTVPLPIQPSVVIIDEIHLTHGEDTGLWRFVKTVVNRATWPLYLVGVSGTPINHTPESIKTFFRLLHSERSPDWVELPPDTPPYYTPQTVNKEFNNLLKLHRQTETRATRRKDIEESDYQAYQEQRRKVLAPFLIRRLGDQPYLGGPAIIPLPSIKTEEIECGVPDDTVEDLADLSKLAAEQVQNMRLDGMDTNRNALSRTLRRSGRFNDLLLCATFPGAARFMQHDAGLFTADRCAASSRATTPQAAIEKSPYRGIIDQLTDCSPKLRFIYKTVRCMLADKGTVEVEQGDKTAMHEVRKKMVVFCQQPVAAHIIGIALAKKFPALNTAWALAQHSSKQRDNAYRPFNDQAPIDDEDIDLHTDPRILVTTTGLSSVGLNLVRANYCILVQSAWSKGENLQTFHRIHRLGQLQKDLHFYELQCPGIAAERITLQRVGVRAILNSDFWAVTPSPEGTQLIQDEDAGPGDDDAGQGAGLPDVVTID